MILGSEKGQDFFLCFLIGCHVSTSWTPIWILRFMIICVLIWHIMQFQCVKNNYPNYSCTTYKQPHGGWPKTYATIY